MYTNSATGVVIVLSLLIGCTDVPDAGLLEEQVAAQKMMLPPSTCVEMEVNASTPSGSGHVPGDDAWLFMDFYIDQGYTQADLKRIVWSVTTTDQAYPETNWDDCGDGTNRVFAEQAKWGLQTDENGMWEEVTDPADWRFFDANMSACTTAATEVRYVGANLAKGQTGVREINVNQSRLDLWVDLGGASSVDDDEVQFTLEYVVVDCGSGEERVVDFLPSTGGLITF